MLGQLWHSVKSTDDEPPSPLRAACRCCNAAMQDAAALNSAREAIQIPAAAQDKNTSSLYIEMVRANVILYEGSQRFMSTVTELVLTSRSIDSAMLSQVGVHKKRAIPSRGTVHAI
jgi:hypothetical protein